MSREAEDAVEDPDKAYAEEEANGDYDEDGKPKPPRKNKKGKGKGKGRGKGAKKDLAGKAKAAVGKGRSRGTSGSKRVSDEAEDHGRSADDLLGNSEGTMPENLSRLKSSASLEGSEPEKKHKSKDPVKKDLALDLEAANLETPPKEAAQDSKGRKRKANDLQPKPEEKPVDQQKVEKFKAAKAGNWSQQAIHNIWYVKKQGEKKELSRQRTGSS